MVSEFKARRDIIVEGLKRCSGIEFVVPNGAFYIFPKISNFGLSSREFCNRLLEKTGIAATPGNTFGKAGEGFFRLAYGCSKAQVTDAMDRLYNFTKKYNFSLSYKNIICENRGRCTLCFCLKSDYLNKIVIFLLLVL